MSGFTENFVLIPMECINTISSEELKIYKAIGDNCVEVVEKIDDGKNLLEYFAAALRSGNVEIIKILYNKLFTLKFDSDVEKRNRRLVGYVPEAGRWGHVDVLEWWKSTNIQMDGNVYTQAAEKGQVKVLDWALKNNVHCDNYKREICYNAAEKYENVNEWIKFNKFSMFE